MQLKTSLFPMLEAIVLMTCIVEFDGYCSRECVMLIGDVWIYFRKTNGVLVESSQAGYL